MKKTKTPWNDKFKNKIEEGDENIQTLHLFFEKNLPTLWPLFVDRFQLFQPCRDTKRSQFTINH